MMDSMQVAILPYFVKTDVVAVKFDGDYVLTGIGGALNVYSITGALLLKQEVFQGQKIHGICERHEETIAIFGGRQVALINIECNGDEVRSSSKPITWHNNDWILHLKWVEDHNIVLMTAHNELSLWDSRDAAKLKSVSCSEQYIIYSALLLGSTWADIVAIAGTVFKDVVIWMPVGNQKENSNQPVLYRLQGHKGVIFSISYNHISHRLCTTSDDRSVRVWSVRGDWHSAVIELQHTMFGHTARVWDNMVLGDIIVSVGEDSQVCVWDGSGQLLSRWSAHQGGRIWGLDCSPTHNLIVTGGGDGGIRLWPLRGWETVSLIPVPLPFPKDLVPRRICLAHKAVVIAITECGSLMYRTCDQNDWHVVEQNSRLKSYSILEISPCKEFVAVATLDGSVFIYQVKYDRESCGIFKILERKLVEGKVLSLQWATSKHIITSSKNCLIDVWKFDKTLNCIEASNILSLPKRKECWVTSAVLFNTADKHARTTADHLFCGDRGGSIHVYKLINHTSYADPVTSFNRIHGSKGVCSLSVLNGMLFSTGRDGTVRQFEFVGSTLEHLSTDNVPMDWVTNVIDSPYGLLVLGFSEVNFVLWRWKDHCKILEIDCGGGHRSWDFSLNERNEFTFVFLKEKTVHSISCSLNHLVMPNLQDGFHTKEVGCMCVLPISNADSPVVISGSEDTTIRISAFTSTNQFDTLSVLRSHICSVRALAIFLLSDSKSAIVFSAGGRANMRVWTMTPERLSDNSTTVKCQHLGSHMLRVQDRRPWRVAQAEPLVDPETRYMDLCSFQFPNEPEQVMILAGCSDGILRLFSFNIVDKQLELELEFPDYHKRCILKVSRLPLQTPDQVLLSMTTDGQAAFWVISKNSMEAMKKGESNMLENLKPFESLKLHQSGVNSYDLIELEQNKFLLATGGDDNAMVLTVLLLETSPVTKVTNILQRKIESMHSAQITGIKFKENYLFSGCIDQRVRMWTWAYNHVNATIDCSLIGEYCSTVADLQGLCLWETKDFTYVCVHGKGMEIIKVKCGDQSENKLTR